MFSSFLLAVILLFILGAAVGSFLNVIIYRSVRNESWVWGRSKCEQCLKQLRWYDNIPLFSFFVLQGKCRYCHTPIAVTHPVIEFLTGTLFVWWYLGGTFFFHLTQRPFAYIQPLFWLVVGVLLVIIFFADALYSIIPDEAVGILAAVAFLYRVTLTASGVMQPADFLRTLGGVVICAGFFLSLWLITKGKGMGFGDVKFAVPFALLLGWPNVFVGLFLAFVIGGAVASVLLLLKKKKLKQAVPFGPFLIVSTLLTLVWGTTLLHWYLSRF